MATVTVTTLRPFVSARVYGCPNPIIDNEIVNAARTLCEKSLIWREDPQDGIAIAGIDTIDIDIPVDDAELIGVEWVYYNNVELSPATEQELNRDVPLWRMDSGTPRFYIVNLLDSTIKLYPKPSITSAQVSYQLTLRPIIQAATLPEFLTTHFQETIVSGALSELMNMSGQGVTWSNPNEAMRQLQKFKSGIYEARYKARAGATTRNDQVLSHTLA